MDGWTDKQARIDPSPNTPRPAEPLGGASNGAPNGAPDQSEGHRLALELQFNTV
jgi:hypothetical protein